MRSLCSTLLLIVGGDCLFTGGILSKLGLVRTPLKTRDRDLRRVCSDLGATHLENNTVCLSFERETLTRPPVQGARKVPFRLLSYGEGEDPPYTFLANAASNPSFRADYFSPSRAKSLLLSMPPPCRGAPVTEETLRDCLFLFGEGGERGGVFVSSTLLLLHPIEEVVSMSHPLSMGLSLPSKLGDGNATLSFRKEGSILSSSGEEETTPFFSCLVSNRTRMESPIDTCLGEAVFTYKATPTAPWPRSGLMGERDMLAFRTV